MLFYIFLSVYYFCNKPKIFGGQTKEKMVISACALISDEDYDSDRTVLPDEHGPSDCDMEDNNLRSHHLMARRGDQ